MLSHAQNAGEDTPMPYLYGQPFKNELRKEIAELKRDFWNERKEHATIRRSLRFARAKIEELEAMIERMKQHLQGAIVEADRDLGPAIVERYTQSFQTLFDDVATG